MTADLAAAMGPAISAADFEFVSHLVRERAAIVLEPGKEYLVEARLLPLARKESLAGLAGLVEKLRHEPHGALASAVVEAMTTNETSFFRDLHPFDALRQIIVPELLTKRAATRQLRIWSAASSSGQEAYSVLMTLREHFPALAAWDVRVVGTDLSREMVRRATEGRFSQIEINRGLPMNYLLKYLQKAGPGWQVKDELRRQAEFHEMNLIGKWPTLPPMDVIFLRNVLIYFDPPTRRDIVGRMRSVLRPDGFLVLGSSESLQGIDAGWRREQAAKLVVWRP